MEVLPKENYSKAVDALKEVQINSLFARAVAENHVSGTIYVDDIDRPTVFYVIHPYGMSLLLGKNDNQDFNRAFRDYALNKNGIRNAHEWMQAYPAHWNSTLKDLFADCLIRSSANNSSLKRGVIELNTRVNFEFNSEKYFELRKSLKAPPASVIKTRKQEYDEMEGTVIPSNFWNNANEFLQRAIGFSTYVEDELACTAFASFILEDSLELGMETTPQFRGKGLARYTCSKLIDYCLANSYVPIWACRLENIGSYRLAQSLGFEDVLQMPYYRLSN